MKTTPSITDVVSFAKEMGNGEVIDGVAIGEYEATEIAAILAGVVESLMKEAVDYRTTIARLKEQYNLNFNSLCTVIEPFKNGITINSDALKPGAHGNKVITYRTEGDFITLCLSSVGDVVDNTA